MDKVRIKKNRQDKSCRAQNQLCNESRMSSIRAWMQNYGSFTIAG